VRSAAAWALERATGLRLRADAARWRAWLRAETLWFEREGERLGRELRDPSAEVAIRALGELAGHRWRRHELARVASSALEHGGPRVRRLACLALARLGSGAARAALERALEDEDEGVARAARAALETLGLAPLGEGSPAGAILGQRSRNEFPWSRNLRRCA